jgi:predicted nucleic acid-binding protein
MTNVRSPGAFLPDSHSIVWDFLRDPQLSERARDIFRLAERGGATLVIPTIVLAEVHRISERRIRNVSTDAVLRWVAGIPSLDVAPFDFDVFTEMRRQPIELSLHDRIIAATARVYGATLISRDRQLGSVVETVW